MAEACLECGVKRMIHTSSIQALAEPPKGTVIDESRPFDPAGVIGDYAKSKARASLEVLSAVRRGPDAVILCPTGAIGRLNGIHVWQLKMIAGMAWAYNWVRNTVPGVTLDEAGIVASNAAISHEKATRELGFRPRPMRDTMFDAIAWFRQNGPL